MEFLLSHCQAVIGDHGGLLLTLFLGGLMGSATHCVGMCGPFVVAQTASLRRHRRCLHVCVASRSCRITSAA
ncbi:urease accessory protein UreH domain-containing protein [Kordiimonas gwangyangensis]|uniref:urease accessory protein UreH domain-containing protein n=1 Tax=Kordiimonas gwangyangensis TaxID=288022 RepID=UPI0009DE0B25